MSVSLLFAMDFTSLHFTVEKLLSLRKRVHEWLGNKDMPFVTWI